MGGWGWDRESIGVTVVLILVACFFLWAGIQSNITETQCRELGYADGKWSPGGRLCISYHTLDGAERRR